ncbi:hypothetical protein Pmani_007540 [Petrolisthes manimaculis]|uniref:Uncharacterized protein n=1 Tax=Petrolisthes manimaculis TaxID=1843537 RepID=A0AAE1UKP4_9EUCA|nr:hypothetical protein Pmani_007540 [Petrolisthes manimaculis]
MFLHNLDIPFHQPTRNHTIVPRQYNIYFIYQSVSTPSTTYQFLPITCQLLSTIYQLPSTIYQPTSPSLSPFHHLPAHSSTNQLPAALVSPLHTTCQPPPPSTSPLQHQSAHSSTCQLLFTRCQQP